MIDSIMIVGVLTYCVLLHSLCVGYNAMEATKNNCYAKAEGRVDHRTVIR